VSEKNPIRAITVAAYNLVDEDRLYQQSFFNKEIQENLEMNKKLDGIRKKYGFGVLKKAIELDETFTCDAKIDDGFVPFDKENGVKDDE
jgi:hypothetical protein